MLVSPISSLSNSKYLRQGMIKDRSTPFALTKWSKVSGQDKKRNKNIKSPPVNGGILLDSGRSPAEPPYLKKYGNPIIKPRKFGCHVMAVPTYKKSVDR